MLYKIGHRFLGLDPAFCDQLTNFKLLIWLTIIESLWSLVNSPHYFRSAHVKIWLNRQWIYVYSRLDRLFVAISRRQKKGPADRKGPNVCYWKWFFFLFESSAQIYGHIISRKNWQVSIQFNIPWWKVSMYHHNPLLIRNRSLILTIHKARILRKELLEKPFLDFKSYDGARTVYDMYLI